MRQSPDRYSVTAMRRRGKVSNAVFKHKTLFGCSLKYTFLLKLMRILNCVNQYCDDKVLQKTGIHFTQTGFTAFQNVCATTANI